MAKAVIPSPDERLLYGKAEAAGVLDIGINQLDAMIASGNLRTIRIGRRDKIHRNELNRVASGKAA
jgi:hypothetical protein